MISIRKMTEKELAEYLQHAIPDYASEKIKGEGLSPEHARKIAEESYARLLPKGLASENQHLFSVIEDSSGKNIGVLWLCHKQEANKSYAFIYDILLAPEVRGRGYGKLLMRFAEEETRKLGLNSIGLHVFGHNTTAIGLYEKMGFHTTNRIMKKDL